jgi:hypothetical protein
MLEWLKERRRAATIATGPMTPRAVAKPAGKYGALQKYLQDRYANTVVLSLDQIEDLLGFPLPEEAKTDPKWWTEDEASAHPSQSLAWTSAQMTVQPNLAAHIVAFERAP